MFFLYCCVTNCRLQCASLAVSSDSSLSRTVSRHGATFSRYAFDSKFLALLDFFTDDHTLLAFPVSDAALNQELLDLVQQASHYRQLKKGANEGTSSHHIWTPQRTALSLFHTHTHTLTDPFELQSPKPSTEAPQSSSFSRPTPHLSPSYSTSRSWPKIRTSPTSTSEARRLLAGRAGSAGRS